MVPVDETDLLVPSGSVIPTLVSLLSGSTTAIITISSPALQDKPDIEINVPNGISQLKELLFLDSGTSISTTPLSVSAGMISSVRVF
mgnify:CR=1 FL=1